MTTFDFQNCKLLEKMDLEECLLITDATLTHLAMGCPRLEELVSTELIICNIQLGMQAKNVERFVRVVLNYVIFFFYFFIKSDD